MDQTDTAHDTVRTVVWLAADKDDAAFADLARLGWTVVHAGTTAQAERALADRTADVGLVDVAYDSSPQELAALAAFVKRGNAIWVAMISPGQIDDEGVCRFILDYCFDFVTRPCPVERLGFALGHAHGLARLKRAADAAPAVARDAVLGRHAMIGQCDAMQQLYRRIDRCATNDASVFIAGESGTGKELTARAVHDRSARAGEPFVAINCAAIPPSLLQAELFGYEKGAFTGALQRKIGRIEAAHRGTLFLDEIGDMPHECQAVLLRFLQEGTIERLGGRESVRVDVRVISATHVDLDEAIAQGRFRADLYHRFCVLRLVEPPLRERGGDIKLLADHALRMYMQDGHRKIRGFSADATIAMMNYAWPGNVRELINRVRRAVVMTEDRVLSAVDLGLDTSSAGPAETLAEIRNRAEREAVASALKRNGYNLSEAANELGVSRATLYRLIAATGLQSEIPPGIASPREASSAKV
ncbi:sigma-54-dependent transcriptional regulator [Pararobbsia silviterrae]|uniref:Sigma-54-dependent Fis family transcriptional regulator n=1 Tax=Pararobbsia silviterrae TaxID=1792498 RepID=A0A494Y8R9_9BURK|nr:sigma-54 dependent transcriptional regulator [Pararobbsia silviterrae]RKP59082.1 sigma-54-dependent Fis family transcriptional regulator [Pararobbsia silviterrae]